MKSEKFARSLVSNRNHYQEIYDTIYFGVRGKKTEEDQMTAIACAIKYAGHVGHKVIVRITLGEPRPLKGNHDHWYGSYPDPTALEEAFKTFERKVFFEILPASLERFHYDDVEFNKATIDKGDLTESWSEEEIIKNILEKIHDFADKLYGVELLRETEILNATGYYEAWGMDKPSYHVKHAWGFKDLFQARHFKTLFNDYILKERYPYTTWYDTKKKQVKSIVDPAPYSRNQAWRCAYNHKLEDVEKSRILVPVWGSKTGFKDHLVGVYNEEDKQKIVFVETDIQAGQLDKEKRKYKPRESNRVCNVELAECKDPIPKDLLQSVINKYEVDRVFEYEEWIRTGFGIFNVSYASGYPEVGLEIFDTVSKKAPNYDANSVLRLWNSIRYRPDGIGWSCLRAWLWKTDPKEYQRLRRGEFREHMRWIDMAEIRAHYMPDYDKLESAGIDVFRYQSSTVQQLDLEKYDILCIRSPMASRKSKAVVDLILTEEYDRVLVILPRKALSQDFLGKTNTLISGTNAEYILSYLKPDKIVFKDDDEDENEDEEDVLKVSSTVKSTYEDNNEKSDLDDEGCSNDQKADKYEDLNKYNRLGIQAESLHRVDLATYDLVIVDESEAVLSQFSSPTMTKKKGCKEVFQDLFSNSKKLVLMDANQTDKTYNVVNRLRGSKRVQCHVNLGDPNAPKKWAVPILGKSGKEKGLLMARAVVAKLNKGEKIAVYSTSQRYAARLKNKIQNLCPTKSCMLYDGKTDGNVKQQHFKNVDKYWVQYDIVIYTPTVSVGVSFEVPDFFECLFVYAYNQSCPIQDIFQGTARIRKLKSDTMYFALIDDSFAGKQLPLTYDKVLGEAIAHGTLSKRYIGSDRDLAECPNEETDKLNSLLADLHETSLEDLDKLWAVQMKFIERLKSLKTTQSLREDNDWMLDVIVRNDWGLNITHSSLTFARVFYDYCGITGWTLKEAVTDLDIKEMECRQMKTSEVNQLELPESQQYKNIPVITREQQVKIKKKIMLGSATRLEQVASDKFWFDNEFVQNKACDISVKASVFEGYQLDKEKQRVMMWKFAEVCRDPDRMIASQINDIPYTEMFPVLPSVLKALRRVCDLLGLQNTHDCDTKIPDSVLTLHEKSLQPVLIDLTKLLRIRVSHSKAAPECQSRRLISSVLHHFSGAKLVSKRDRKESGKKKDGKRAQISLNTSKINIGDGFLASVVSLLSST